MSKFKLIIFLVITMIFISCNGNQQNHIEINQKNTELPIIFRLAKDNNNRIITMQLPVEFAIKNSNFKEITFLRMYYNYNNIPINRKGGFGISLFKRKNGMLCKVKNSKIRLKGNTVLDYVCYSSHFIDSIQSVKLHLYVKEMDISNKDTLSISISEIRMKNGDLFESLTQNDSISIQFLNSSTKSGLGERIAVPVNW